MRVVIHIVMSVLLTLFTQIGGVAYLFAVLIARRSVLRIPGFLAAYLVMALTAQTLSDRTIIRQTPDGLPVDAVNNVQPFKLAQRQYVTPELNRVLNALAAHMEARFPGTQTHVLDGSFPLFDGFPLLSHLSHKDGKKVDIAFYYRDGRPKSPIGYFAFEQPKVNDPQPCAGRNDYLTLRWNMGWLAPLWRDVPLDEVKTAEAIRWLATVGRTEGNVTKIFVEPHLVRRLGLENLNLNFQGCRAARHDDHIHFQVK